MQTKNLVRKQKEVAYTSSTNQAAALLALGCKFSTLPPKEPGGKPRAQVVRVYTEKRPPGTTGEVTYFFEGKSSEYPQTDTRAIIGEWHLAREGRHKLEGRGDAAEEFEKTFKALAEAIQKQNFNGANKLLRDLTLWLPLAIAVAMRNALETRDSLMKEWVYDLEKLSAVVLEKDADGHPLSLRGQNLSPAKAALLDNR